MGGFHGRRSIRQFTSREVTRAEVETMLYRIAQEALNNVSKHAQAEHAEVILERRGPQAVLIVEDNGIGFDVNPLSTSGARGGLGLIGMRERTAIVGGSFEIETAPDQGTTIFVRVPLVQAGEGS